jgi:hypothetical protein
MLHSFARGLFTKLANGFQDLVGGFGPDEGRNVPNFGDAPKTLWDYFASVNDKFRRTIRQDGKWLRWQRRQAGL